MIPLCTPSPEQADMIEVHVVRSLNEMMEVIAIRSIVYMGEQDCPFEEEFDGNDFSGTHLIARINGKPLGTLRLRWFADFAKLERVAVKRCERGGAIVTALCQAAAQIATRKGYTQLLGHIQSHLAPFWIRHGGARLRKDRPRFYFSDHEYVEVIRDLTPHEDPLSIDSEPLVLLRPEGSWDEPGVLDQSARRRGNAHVRS